MHHHHHRRCAAACIYDATISTTGKRDMDPGASAGLWAARAPRAASCCLAPTSSFPADRLAEQRVHPQHLPYMHQHAYSIAKTTVDWVFAAVPCLNTNLSARIAGASPPGSTWKPPPLPVPDPPVTAQEVEPFIVGGQVYQQAHKAAQKVQLEEHVCALQNQQPLDPAIVRAPPPGHRRGRRRRRTRRWKGQRKRRGMTRMCHGALDGAEWVAAWTSTCASASPSDLSKLKFKFTQRRPRCALRGRRQRRGAGHCRAGRRRSRRGAIHRSRCP